MVPSPAGFMTPRPASCSAGERGDRDPDDPRTKNDGGVRSEVGVAQDPVRQPVQAPRGLADEGGKRVSVATLRRRHELPLRHVRSRLEALRARRTSRGMPRARTFTG